MNSLLLSMSMLRRDWRAGELGLLLAALLVAVAAISSVGFFVDRMKQALSAQASQLLGADLAIASDQPIDEALTRRAAAAGLRVAQTVTFPSMVTVAGQAQLASIKAVSSDYPLRGNLRVAAAPNQADSPAQGTPAPGTAWADAQLLQSLGVTAGGALQLGEAGFTAERVITLEPDRDTNFVNFAPRLMISLADLPATRLIQPGSRITYRMLFAGAPDAVKQFEAATREQLLRGQRIESLEGGRPALQATLDRARKFLALVALLTALIAAVAIALATRRFAERHLDGCAVIRAIGASQAHLTTLLGLELVGVGLIGGAAGVALGWGVHFLLVQAIANLLELPLPLPTVWPALQALAAGLVLLLGFGAWPVLRLAGVAPLRVLRRDLGTAPVGPWLALGIALAAFAALLWWLAGDRQLAAIALGGFAAGALVFVLATLGALRLISPLRRVMAGNGGAPALRLALASWSRRRGATVAQTVALAVGLMALMLLTVTRTDLLDSWRRASPADAPNRFVINIQPDQREEVVAQLAAAGIRNAELFPMIRGRLVEVDGKPVGPESYTDDRAQRLIDREFNLSYSDLMPAHNQALEGRWLDPAKAEVSVEQGIMKTLGLTLGDQLQFDIAGERVSATVVGTRKLAWDSMKVNFFMILSPAALRDRPQTLITAFHEPAQRASDKPEQRASDAPAQRAGGEPARRAGGTLGNELIARFPNLTIFDSSNIVRQVQALLDQVIRAVQFLFVLTLVAGVVVLYAALASSRDDRIREAGLMRALGASRAQLMRAQWWELSLAGGLAGLLAAIGALTIGMVLAQQVFQLDYQPRWWGLAGGVLAGALVAALAGWFGLRGVLNTPPMSTLRNA